jgi:hypothetical protein
MSKCEHLGSGFGERLKKTARLSHCCRDAAGFFGLSLK